MRDTPRKSGDLRKQRNVELLRRMRSGEPLNAIDSKASWYPPRPIIAKDQKEMARVYKETLADGKAARLRGKVQVVELNPAQVGAPTPLGEAS